MSAKLVLGFKDNTGADVRYNYNYADTSVESSAVSSYMDLMITHGAIFQRTPVSKVYAKIVITTETDIDIS